MHTKKNPTNGELAGAKIEARRASNLDEENRTLSKEQSQKAKRNIKSTSNWGHSVSPNEFLTYCRQLMIENGLEPPAVLETDGSLHRCGTAEKEHGRDGAYIIHLHEPYALWWKNWRTGDEGTHTAKTKGRMSQEERSLFHARLAKEKVQREADRQQRYHDAATKAQHIWKTAIAATGAHPYLVTKQVPAYGLKVAHDGCLIIPVLNPKGQPQSLQFISANGAGGNQKRFLSGGKTAEGFFSIPSHDHATDGVLCITEGYATAASIHLATGYGVLVAFNAGNLEAVALLARKQYPERKIILCADNDLNNAVNTGVVKATKAAQAIAGLLAVPSAHLDKNTDFNDVHQYCGLEAVATCINNATALEQAPQAEIIPLRKAPQSAKDYPTHAFGGLADVVRAFAEGVKVPYAMAGGSLLTTLAACTQSVANVVTKDGRTIPLSLYALTIADSGDRKTSLDTVVLQRVTSVENVWHQQYKHEQKLYDDAKATWEKQTKQDRDIPFEREAPKIPTMQIENVNIEGIFRLLKEGRPSLAIFSDEAGSIFGGTAFHRDNVLKTISFFSKLWDGKSLDKVRNGEGFSRLYGRRASVHLMVQPAIAETILADGLIQGQGFLSRFLISWPTTRKGTRFYTKGNLRELPVIQDFYDICERLLQAPLRIDEQTDGMIFDSLCIDDDAHDLWVQHHDVVEAMLAPDGKFAKVAAIASKNSEQTLRIAGVLTLVSSPEKRTISADIMANAIMLARWYLDESLRLREHTVAPDEILKAEKLLRWILKERYKCISVRLIMRRGPSSLRLKKEADVAIYTLEEHGYLLRGKGDTVIDGAVTKTFWDVHESVLM